MSTTPRPRISFEIDAASLESTTDGYLSQLWHISQANPSPFGDVGACQFAEHVGGEIIRRFVAAQPPALWARQGRDVKYAQPIVTPPSIGQAWPSQGGVYLGIFEGEHLIACTAPEASFISAWGEYGKNITGAQSRTDGRANTASMAAAGSECAIRVQALDVDGHKDLFIPSQAQLKHAHTVAPPAFEKSDWHWSSTQSSRISAFVQDFQDGYSDWFTKGSEFRVRAFRAIPLQPLNTSPLAG